MPHARPLAALLAASILGAAAPSPQDRPRSQAGDYWQAQTAADLAAAAQGLAATYIYAVYPDPARWRAVLDRNLAMAQRELPRAQDFGGYRAVLQHFAASFHDAHLRFAFALQATSVRWPGFLLRFRDGRYVTAASTEPGVRDGAVVTACDGTPIQDLIARVATVEIGLPMALETTRMDAALRLMVDRGNPLYPLPRTCTIDGRTVTLAWRNTAEAALGATAAALRARREPLVATRLVGDDGAWVRLGYFMPGSVAQADAFRAATAAAPSLRDKRFIVLDVRGNGGGPYNWFMAYLRGLYGQPYADHYATARLRIRGVYRLTPAIVAWEKQGQGTDDALGQPADPPFAGSENQDDRAAAIAAGRPFYHARPIDFRRPAAAPANPVKAKVIVLTDYGCGSACIAFVDELKLFPGVVQVGLPTYVDSRSGTPMPVALPSHNAELQVATMTRDGRVRDDNVAQDPSIRFRGDITDDRAVEQWVVHDVVGAR